MKQKVLAEIIGISPQRLSFYKNGVRTPNAKMLELIKDKLDLDTIDQAWEVLKNPNKVKIG